MDDYGYGYWGLVILNIAVFGLFIISIPFRKKIHRLPVRRSKLERIRER
ncbi:MAG: hypothetical protein WED05_06370 [Candidatus Atabeyarchaeum deiterrae]